MSSSNRGDEYARITCGVISSYERKPSDRDKRGARPDSAEQDKLEASKTDVGWGHQIRSYVLDQSRIKDLRTNVEISNTQKVLDGDLDAFIEASLKQGV